MSSDKDLRQIAKNASGFAGKMARRALDAEERNGDLEAEVERLRKERNNASEDLAHAYTLMKTAIAQLSSTRQFIEKEKGTPLRENAAINVEIRRLKAAHPEWEHIQDPSDALDRAGDDCDHEWRTESRITEPSRSTAHPGGASPPEHKQIQSCTKCGATRGGSDD